MKNLFTLLFVAGIATGVFANNESLVVQIKQTETAKVAIAFNEAPEGTVTVKITDSKDRVILRDRIHKSEAFSKKYDLNSLPEGIYSVEVLEGGKIVKNMSINTQPAATPVVFSRVSQINRNQYRLVVSSLTSKDVEIMIYDNDELIHTEMIDNPQGLHKIFTIQSPNVGGISFRVKSASGFDSFVSSN